MSGPAVFDDVDSLLSAAPRDLGYSRWVAVDEAAFDRFARATGRADGGYFALALTNQVLPELMAVPGAASGVNYGADSVHFGPPPAPGGRMRVRAMLAESREVPGGVQTAVDLTVEVEGAAEPACRLRSLSRWMR